VSRRLQAPTTTAPAGGFPQEFTPDNPCSINAPYYIGTLSNAAVKCTKQCPGQTYPNNAEFCHPCTVVGCETCGRTTCRDCLIMHLKVGQNCIYYYLLLFGFVVLFAVCFCLCGTLRFCCLALFSARSPNVLKEALLIGDGQRFTTTHSLATPFTRSMALPCAPRT
jgi:hypothetical protein